MLIVDENKLVIKYISVENKNQENVIKVLVQKF